MSQLFRSIPSMDILLAGLSEYEAVAKLPRTLVRDLTNAFLDQIRVRIKDGRVSSAKDLAVDKVLPDLAEFVLKKSQPHFRRVLNATGVVVHTNLGRSLLAKSAVDAVVAACSRYSNLEFSLETGARGSRYSHVEDLLCRLTGAEAGLVVNNNAAAVMLVLDTMAKNREVIVSRGELVEIGGSFRIPEVMAKSGAILKEVGATNRTHLKDYENAIGPETAALMKVHTSNFRIIGFHSSVSLKELVTLGQAHKLPVIEDLGSGNLFSFGPDTGLSEPRVQDSVAGGADVVTFSGDKLLGGPQAGIILGKKVQIEAIKKNPMNRALRIDKMTLAALEATLRLYLDPELARREIPTLAMITDNLETISAKASRLAAMLRRELGTTLDVAVVQGQSRVGGGASPETDLPTRLVAVKSKNSSITVDGLKDRLLGTEPPLIARIENECFCLDPRTLQADEFKLVVAAMRQALAGC